VLYAFMMFSFLTSKTQSNMMW